MLTLVLLKALSLQQLPALQEMFDGRRGAQNMSSCLAGLGYVHEDLWSLLDLVMEQQ